MAKHRAPVEDRWSREERVPTPVGGARRNGAVGVAPVPATSRLTPPGREIRRQGPRPTLAHRPTVTPASVGRHRRCTEPKG
ncbi:hypothetical protein Vlu01_53300 [Micromonospora lutea]|uniref:Uncharacterized protein n=1 Tax=Micromonospora lutea TaxID=419825 RepID=A0ABQ4J3F9_9ACTN|nr:hypothetical protein Vlu01_53300 [Micromonospora lutea]